MEKESPGFTRLRNAIPREAKYFSKFWCRPREEGVFHEAVVNRQDLLRRDPLRERRGLRLLGPWRGDRQGECPDPAARVELIRVGVSGDEQRLGDDVSGIPRRNRSEQRRMGSVNCAQRRPAHLP